MVIGDDESTVEAFRPLRHRNESDATCQQEALLGEACRYGLCSNYTTGQTPAAELGGTEKAGFLWTVTIFKS